MSTAITKQNTTLMQKPDEDALQIRVALNQNLWGLPDEQVWQYYRSMCGHLKLDPASKPFDIITDTKTSQKKLYPNTSCTSQLGDMARLSYGKIEIDVNDGMLKLGFKVAHVAVEVRHPNGRSLVSEAFVDLMSGWEGKPLAGNNLVNALKKAATQCRRRGTLQALGLVAPSEEIPTVKLGDMERTEGDVDGVIIEHPPVSALTVENVHLLQESLSHNAPPMTEAEKQKIRQQIAEVRAMPDEFTEGEKAIYKSVIEDEEVTPVMSPYDIALAAVLDICEAHREEEGFIREVNRQVAAFTIATGQKAGNVRELSEPQLGELKTGLELYLSRKTAKAATV